MSDIIHLLPDSVANQIAAGEVIQRPASIIKELVENSLDAGATHVHVVVEDAGKSLVQVIDDGCGMSATDARLSFERHATSKIQQATDLFALKTMGFRGEALASIAAVAQVELRTRRANEELGTSISIEGSKVVNQEPVSCPVGANFSVRNLFFNIPARRKFLKSNQTELTNITAEFERIALAHPEIAFTLQSGSNIMLDLRSGNFRQRIVGMFGRKLDTQLVPIGTETTLAAINGFVGMPSSAKRKNSHQYFFVNGRYMRHPYFAKALQTAYDRLIPDGYQIPYFIEFQVDPSRIDVNIHPTKTEIKFEDDSAIFQILLAAIRESLGKYGAVPTIDFDVEGKPEIPTFGGTQGGDALTPPKIHINAAYNPFEPSVPNTSSPSFSSESDFRPSFLERRQTIDWKKVYEAAQNPVDFGGTTQEMLPTSESVRPQETSLYDELSSSEQQEWKKTAGTDFMQYEGRYIITPLNTGLAIIDQHRAHTRVLYELYMRQLEQHQAPSQRLLFPEMLNVLPSESLVLDSIMPKLQEVGFDISPLGKGTYSILATPVNTEGIDPVSLVSTILSDAVEGQANAAETVAHVVSISLARKVAIPVGQLLSDKEMNQLVEELFTCETPNLTPDGHPTLVVLNPQKMF